MSKNIYKSVRTFSNAFKEYVWSDEMLLYIPEFGWCDGGCRSLMKAVELWLGKEVTDTYQIVRGSDREHSDHALIKVGKYYIDGYGICVKNTIYKRWKYEERLPSVYIKPFNPLTEPPNGDEEPHYIEQGFIKLIAEKLDIQFEKEKLLKLLLAS